MQDTSSLKCRRADSGLWDLAIDPRILQHLLQAGFYGVSRIGSIRLDHSLITALVERWRQETHTFHMLVGECTITLQDVSVLFGLRVDGTPVIGYDQMRSSADWQLLCFELLGVAPADEDLQSGRVRVSWFQEHFTGVIPAYASAEVIRQHARAYILWLIGGFLMPDKSQNLIKLMYLPLLIDLGQVHRYSWGAAVLAYLYRQLCRATRPDTREIAGPLVLLQIWAWERFPRIAPRRKAEIGPGQATIQHGDQVLPGGPWGSRWHVSFALDQVVTHVVTAYRDQFDRLTVDEFIWMPYGLSDEIIMTLPEYCRLGMDVWMTRSPLICYDVVEWHLPDRVLRQFGRQQSIPPTPDTDRRLHGLDRRGRMDTDWTQVHEGPITSWGMRRAQLVVASRTDVPMGYHDPYMLWYRRVTRLLLTNPSHRQAPGYLGAGGIIEELTQCVAYTYQEADTWLRGHSPRDTAFQTVLGIRDRCYTSLLAVHKEHCLQPPQAPSTTQQSSPSSPSVGPLASMTVGPHSPHSVIPIVTSTVAPQLQFLSPASGPSSSIPSSSAVPSLHRDFLDITHGVSQSQLPQVPPLPVRGRGRGRGRGRARARGRDLPQVPSVAVSQEVDPSEVL